LYKIIIFIVLYNISLFAITSVKEKNNIKKESNGKYCPINFKKIEKESNGKYCPNPLYNKKDFKKLKKLKLKGN